MLSAGTIEYLMSYPPIHSSDHSVQLNAIFFYFEKDNPLKIHPSDAIKALASQLIYLHRNDRNILDGLTLLTETEISGQLRASGDDAERVIQFLLDRFPSYIILDAVDECSDPHLLLIHISYLCENVDSKILLLSRPDINLPWRYRVAEDLFRVIRPSESHNLPDISRFLEDEVRKAIKLGLFENFDWESEPEIRMPVPEDMTSLENVDYNPSQTRSQHGRSLERRTAQDGPRAVWEDSDFSSSQNSHFRESGRRQRRESLADPIESSYHASDSFGGHIADRCLRSRSNMFDECSVALAQWGQARESHDDLELQQLCAIIATQSKGMFLWARLLVNYLNSPALSPSDRLEAIAWIHYLGDIDQLYLSILEKVVPKFQKEKDVAIKIFRWLAFALCPLPVDSLHTAITLRLGKPTSRADRLIDFAESIQKITCALVEMDDRGILRFIHTSFADFLMGTNRELVASGFSLHNTQAAHCCLATLCLSYLLHNVPREPLQNLRLLPRYDLELPCGEDERLSSQHQTDSSTQALAVRRRKLRKQYPLLHYASMCWA